MKRGRPIKNNKKITVFLQNRGYENVVKMVSDGATIEFALKKYDIQRTEFYRHISKEQKIFLRELKTSNAKYSGGHPGFRGLQNKYI